MSIDNSSSHEESSEHSHEIAIPHIVQFWIILPFFIPSVICSIFVLYHYITKRTLRKALHNHVIIILLSINFIVQLTSILWNLVFYYIEYVWISVPSFCIIWITVDEGFHISITLFFAWAAIERHIFIFHDRLVATKRKAIIFHYLPLTLIFLYCICYNLIAIIFPPCENTYDYDDLVCGYPLCYYESRTLTIWDVVINHVAPVLLIITCSSGLLCRIVYRKCQMRLPIRWRNYRKMTIQLLSISFLYLTLHAPHIIMEFLYLCGIPENTGSEFMGYAEFFEYYSNLLLPFVCAGSIPHLKTKLKNIFFCFGRQTRTVRPQTLILAHRPALR